MTHLQLFTLNQHVKKNILRRDEMKSYQQPTEPQQMIFLAFLFKHQPSYSHHLCHIYGFTKQQTYADELPVYWQLGNTFII